MAKTTNQNSYRVYLRTIFNGTTVNVRATGSAWASDGVFITWSMFLMMWILGQSSINFTENGMSFPLFSISFFGWAFFVSILTLGMYLRNKPSAFNLLPISWKKRTAYFYVTALVFVALILVGIIACFLVIFATAAIITLAVQGVDFVYEEETVSEFIPMCAQGQLFGVCVILLIIGAATAICLIKSDKLRRLMYYVFPLALDIPLLIMNNLTNGTGVFALSGNIYANFERLPISWLWLTFAAIIAIGAFAFGLYRLIQHERPKDF